MDKERLVAYLERFQRVANRIQADMLQKTEDTGEPPRMSGGQFESVVYEGLKEEGFDENQIYHSPQKFPDFIISGSSGERVGLEVKKTDGAKWEVIGGSVFESLRNDLDETYVIMANFGGNHPEVRIRKYEECIADLKVTHSPRFYLDMDLEEGEDFLSRRNARDLLELSGDQLNQRIRELLRTGKSTWWSDAQITKFSSLSERERDAYLNDGLALFPEILAGDYERFTQWMVYSCLVWCGSVRDIFSAGGKVLLSDRGIYVSAVMGRLFYHAGSIKARILEMTDAEVDRYWGRKPTEAQLQDFDRMAAWMSLARDSLKISKAVIEENRRLERLQGCSESEVEETIRKEFFDAIWERFENESVS